MIYFLLNSVLIKLNPLRKITVFNFSHIKNKLPLFLHLILLFACSGKIYSNPFSTAYQSINNAAKENPLLSACVSGILVTIISHQIDMYYEDTELKNLTKQKKIKDLELKNDPNYVALTLFEKKTEVQRNANDAEEQRQLLVHQELKYRMHVEDKIKEFGLCSRDSSTQEDRDNCKMIHDNYVKRYNAYFSAQ